MRVSRETDPRSWIHEGITRDCVRKITSFLTEQGTFHFPRLPNGLFSAAAGQGADFEASGYTNAWTRDNVHIAHAHWVVGRRTEAVETMETLMEFYRRHRHKFVHIIDELAHHSEPMHRPHVRFNGTVLEELPEKWSHAQNDALGYLLWFYCRLVAAGQVRPGPQQWEVIDLIVAYFAKIRYWEDDDSGHWEEARKVSASSIGVALAGLKALAELCRRAELEGEPVASSGNGAPPVAGSAARPPSSPCGTARRQRARPREESPAVAVHGNGAPRGRASQATCRLLPELIQKGEQALSAILPAECAQQDPALNRHCDAALLFLIYPCETDAGPIAAGGPMANEIVTRVREHLMGPHGIRRYQGDSYWCADYKTLLSPEVRTSDFSDDMTSRDALLQPGKEAQWCIFDPILSIIFGRRYLQTGNPADRSLQLHHLQRSLGQLTGDDSRFGAYRCPESYYSEQGRWVPNDLTPLLWTQANLMLALHWMEQTAGA